MTQPRQVTAGRSVMVTRRALRRHYLFRPDPKMNQLCLYALGVAATRHNILVHDFVMDDDYARTRWRCTMGWPSHLGLLGSAARELAAGRIAAADRIAPACLDCGSHEPAAYAQVRLPVMIWWAKVMMGRNGCCDAACGVAGCRAWAFIRGDWVSEVCQDGCMLSDVKIEPRSGRRR